MFRNTFAFCLQAKEINQNPLWYIIASGFTASFAFMIPVGTPGNLVAQGAANIPTLKMVIYSFAWERLEIHQVQLITIVLYNFIHNILNTYLYYEYSYTLKIIDNI